MKKPIKKKKADSGMMMPQYQNQWQNPWQQIPQSYQQQTIPQQFTQLPVNQQPFNYWPQSTPTFEQQGINIPQQQTQFVSQNSMMSTPEDAPVDQKKKSKQKVANVAGAVGAVAGVAGNIVGGMIDMIPALGALIPDNSKERRPNIPQSVNSNPYGQYNSQALFGDGGTKTGKREPILTTDPRKVQAYNDSMQVHQLSQQHNQARQSDNPSLDTINNTIRSYNGNVPFQSSPNGYISKAPVQPYLLGRPKQTVSPIQMNSSMGGDSLQGSPINSSYQYQSPAFLAPNGEPVHAPISDSFGAFLGYYQQDGTFRASIENPDAAQYNSNPEYMQNLLKKNYGTGYKPSEYANGGTAGYKTINEMQGKSQVSYEIPEWMSEQKGQEINSHPMESIMPIYPQKWQPQISQPKVPNTVSYEKLTKPGFTQPFYLPKFQGDWSHGDIDSNWNSIPEYINNIPVARGNTYDEFISGFDQYSTTPQWKARKFADGGSLKEGDEIEVTEEELKELKKKGYKFDILK